MSALGTMTAPATPTAPGAASTPSGAVNPDDAARRAHENALARRRTRLKAYGRWEPTTDAQPVRDHIADLAEAGIGWMRAAHLAGLSTGAVCRWLYGLHGYPPPEQIRTELAAKMLAVTTDTANLADRALVDPLATTRQIQALAADGYPIAYIAARINCDSSNVSRVMNRSRIEATTARAITALFAELAKTTPAAFGIASRNITYIRNWAAKKGWAPSAAWDGIDMSDPDAFPDFTGHCGTTKGRRLHEACGIPVCDPCRSAKSGGKQERAAARQGAAA